MTKRLKFPKALPDREGFLLELRERIGALPGVKRIEFHGSILTDRYTPGRSDLDLVVEGRVNAATKLRIIAVIKHANAKYAMGLEAAPYLHPVPIFFPTVVGILVRRGGLLALFQLVEPLTRRWRRFQKERTPITLGQYWEGRRPSIRDPRFLLELLVGTG